MNHHAHKFIPALKCSILAVFLFTGLNAQALPGISKPVKPAVPTSITDVKILETTLGAASTYTDSQSEPLALNFKTDLFYDILNDKLLPLYLKLAVASGEVNGTYDMGEDIKIYSGDEDIGIGTLVVTIKLLSPKLEVNIDPDAVGTLTLSGEEDQAMRADFKMTGVKVKGKLHIEAHLKKRGWTVLDVKPDITIKGFSGDMKIKFLVEDGHLGVEKTSDLNNFSLDEIDIDEDDMSWWEGVKEKIGMNQFLKNNCARYDEDFNKCVAALVGKKLNTKNTMKTITDLIDDAIVDATANMLKINVGGNLGSEVRVAGEVELTGFDTTSGIAAGFLSTLNITGNQYGCSSAATRGPVVAMGEMPATSEDVDFVMGHNHLETVMLALVKSGVLCKKITITADDGTTMTGDIAPAGELTFSTTAYDYFTIITTNYDEFVEEYGALANLLDADSTATGTAVSDTTLSENIVATYIDESDYLVAKTSAEGFGVSMPVSFIATKTMSGVPVTVTATATLSLAGVFELNATRELSFSIRQAKISNLAATAGNSFSTMNLNVASVESDANEELSKTFYYIITEHHEFHACSGGVQDGYIRLNNLGEKVSWQSHECDNENCEMELGVSLTGLGLYGKTFYANHFSYDGGYLALGLGTTNKTGIGSGSSEYGCNETRISTPTDTQFIEDSIRFNQINKMVTDWMVHEGITRVEEMLAQFDGSNMRDELMAIVVIDETDTMPKEELAGMMTSIQSQIFRYQTVAPMQITQAVIRPVFKLVPRIRVY